MVAPTHRQIKRPIIKTKKMETNKTKETPLAIQVLRAYKKYCENRLLTSNVVPVIFNYLINSSKEETQKDLLGFIYYTENKEGLNINDSYNRIKEVLTHDIMGLINKEKNFLPKSSGYSKYL